MSATSGLMFHTALRSVVLSSVIVPWHLYTYLYITVDSYLNTFSVCVCCEWHLFSSLFNGALCTDQNHILCLLHQPLQCKLV